MTLGPEALLQFPAAPCPVPSRKPHFSAGKFILFCRRKRHFSAGKMHLPTGKHIFQGRKNSMNINFSVRIRADIPDHHARMPWGQKVSPHHRGRRKTHFLVRMSTIFGADVHDPKGRRKTLYKKSLRRLFGP